MISMQNRTQWSQMRTPGRPDMAGAVLSRETGGMILEIRTYRVKPGTRDEFVRVMRGEAASLLGRYGINVVDSGPSLVDEDGAEEAYLIRSFASLAERDERESAFYGSDDWRLGPREAIVSCIESYHTIVLDVDDSAATALRPTVP